MAEQTDLTLPLTPGKLGRAVDEIVERAFPSPRQEECMPVGEMVRALTALCGEAVQLAYDDAAGIAKDARERLARHLWLESRPNDPYAAAHWQAGDSFVNKEPWRRKADAALAALNGKGD